MPVPGAGMPESMTIPRDVRDVTTRAAVTGWLLGISGNGHGVYPRGSGSSHGLYATTQPGHAASLCAGLQRHPQLPSRRGRRLAALDRRANDFVVAENVAEGGVPCQVRRRTTTAMLWPARPQPLWRLA